MSITHRIRIVALLALVLSLACAGIARAQGLEVSATIDPPQIYAGTTAVLQITIVGADPAAPPTPPGAPVVPGLTIEYSGITSVPAPVVILNGQRQDTGPDKIILQYAVTPASAGRFVIPEMPVRIGARTITTSQLVLRAIEPPVATDLVLITEADNDTVFEGQPVTIVATLTHLNVATASFSASFPAGFDFYPSVSPAETSALRIQPLELNGRQVRAALGTTMRGNEQWNTLSIAYTLIPTRTGTFEIPGFAAHLGIATNHRNRTERRVARAEPITITVKPLPTDGRPADFTGLVGKFDIRTAASVTDVHVGEPIPFSMSITGPRPLERITPPDLRTDPAFSTAFKVSPEGWAETTPPTGPARVREFSTTLRATAESVTEIPAISFSYFDPDRAEYRTASSKPIPLTIRETRQITAADAISSGTGAAGNGYALPRVERVPLDAGPTGPTFATIPHRLTSQHLLLTEQLRSPIIAAAVALPPLTLSVTALLAMRRRSHDPALARSRRALRDALARMGPSPTADRIADAVRTLLASRFALDAHTITAHDARRLIAPIDPPLADDAARALLAADAPRFSDGAAAAPVAPIADPRALLTRLDKATAP